MKARTKLFTILLILSVALAYMPASLAEEVYASTASGQWQKTGSGTQYYAEFPGGYNKGSSLYGKYNRSKLNPYVNASSKRDVSTTRVSFIYWHWTWNASVPTNQNNKLIDDKQGYDGQHDYQFFTDFESTDNYPLWSGDNRVHEYWRNRPEDGSKWWFQIPVYKQTYTDYKYVTSNGEVSNKDSKDSSPSDPSKKKAVKKNKAKKYKPKKTSVNKCRPKKKSCRITWKKCRSKCTGYQIRYCTNKNFKHCKKKKIKGRKNCSCTLTGLTAGVTYYYQVRCCRKVGKKTYCSGWSKCRSFKTKKAKKAKGSSAGTGYTTIRGAAWTTTGGGSKAFSKTVKAVPRERKIRKRYYGTDGKGLYYRKSKNGRKNYIVRAKYIGTAITDGKYVFYSLGDYTYDDDDKYEDVYKYDIRKGTTEYIVGFYYSYYGDRIELSACYGNSLYFNRTVQRMYEGSSPTCDVVKYDMSTGENRIFMRNCEFGEQRGRYITATRHDFHFGINMNELFDFKTLNFKKICKSGNAILAPNNIYYITWGKNHSLYKCSYSLKKRKKVASLRGGYCLWMSDSKIGFMTETNAYTISYKTGRKKKL